MEIRPSDYDYKHMPVGASVQVPHRNCSGAAAMRITVKPDGVLFHCFKCGHSLFVNGEYNYRDKKIRQAEMEAMAKMKADAGFDPPADLSHNIPPVGLAWLGAGGWTADLIRRHNIGWSDKLARVVLPLSPEGWTARAVHKDQRPKYLAKQPKGATWRSSTIVDKVCYVEDILSAGRVGKFIPTEALLGTNGEAWVPPVGINEVVIWTDNDKAGLRCRKDMKRKLMWAPDVVVHDVLTARDPKTYSDAEIKEVLNVRG